MTGEPYRPPPAPRGLGPGGRRLWRAITLEFELAEHELTTLRQAVRTADLCDDLQEHVDVDGPVVAGKPHPVLAELRSQRLSLTRMIVAMRVPLAEDDAAHGAVPEAARPPRTRPNSGRTRPQAGTADGVEGVSS